MDTCPPAPKKIHSTISRINPDPFRTPHKKRLFSGVPDAPQKIKNTVEVVQDPFKTPSKKVLFIEAPGAPMKKIPLNWRS